MHIQGSAFCALCLKSNKEGMFSCVECCRLESGPQRDITSFCSSDCYMQHFGALHRPCSLSKRPSSGSSSSSGSDPGSPPSGLLGRSAAAAAVSPLVYAAAAPQHFYPHVSPQARRAGEARQHYQQQQRNRRA